MPSINPESGPTAGLPVYLDYAATTPVDPRVVQAMLPWLGEQFGNPSSTSHLWGQRAHAAVEQAREQVAALVGAQARDIIWTSGATESNNLAIQGVAHARQAQGRHLITVTTEHKAVLDTMQALEGQGFTVTYLNVQPNGLLALDQLRAALRPDTTLVSVMAVNNEIGVVQDLHAIGSLCREKGIVFHVDAAQATGKIALDVQTMPVDVMSLASHKTYGPKGIGALYVRRKPRLPLQPLIHGGGHERGLRSGTLATHQIVGMGQAFAIAQAEMAQDIAHAQRLQQRLLHGLQGIEQLVINGDMQQRIAHNLNISIPYVEGEALLMALPQLALSSGSACTSASQEPSHVLRALGHSRSLAHSSLRISLGRFTTEADIDLASTSICHAVARLRALSPLWDMAQAGVDVARYPWPQP